MHRKCDATLGGKMTTHGKRTLQILGSIALIAAAIPAAHAGTMTLVTSTFGGVTDTLNFATNGVCVGPSSGTPICPSLSISTISNAFSTSGSNTVYFGVFNQSDSIPITFNPGCATTGEPAGCAGDVNDDAELYDQANSGSFSFDGGFTPTEDLLNTVNNSEQIVIAFASPVSEVGFYAEDGNHTSASTLTIGVNSPATTCAAFASSACTVSDPAGDAEFIGVKTSSGAATINSITITTTSGQVVLGDLTLITGATSPSGPPPAVPEPSTVVMMIGGLGVLGWKARKRVKA
jgi:hypothetical protein